MANRLVLDSEQTPKLIVKGEKITASGEHGSFGFSSRETEEDVVELSHQLDGGKESVYITMKLLDKIIDLVYGPLPEEQDDTTSEE